MTNSDDIVLSKRELIDLHVAIGVLTTRVAELASKADKQDKILEDLVALANQGRGSMWILVTLGGCVGALLGNIKAIAALLLR